MYNGISTNELCKVLKGKFGVLEQYCCDLVQRLKIELDMYIVRAASICIMWRQRLHKKRK